MNRKRKRKIAATQTPAQPKPPTTSAAPSSAWALVGVLAATAVLGGSATPLFAQNAAPTTADGRATTLRFAIPAGRLDEAIAAFTRTTGLVVNDPTALVSDLTTRGVSGSLSADEAMRRLLEGSGLAFQFTSSRAIRLERRTTHLQSVSVMASRAQAAPSSAKYTQPVRDIPQTITVVPQQVLAAQGVTSLRDAVRNVPGLTVNAGEGGATPGDNFNIRGFSARGDIFVDGVRDLGGYSRETFNIEQVEVTKGPSSVYSGRGSTGGAVNLVTKSPHLGSEYSAVLGVGNADYYRGTLDINQSLDSVGIRGAAFRMNAMWQEAGVANLPVVERKGWGVAPSLAFGLGSATQVTLQYFHSTQNNIPVYGLMSQTTDGPPDSIDIHQYFGLTDIDHEDIRADQATAKLVQDLGRGFTLRNTLAWGHVDTDRIVTYTRLDGTRNSPSHITDDANLTNQLNIVGNVHTGRVEHATVLGVELSHEKSIFSSYHFSTAAPPVGDINNVDPNQPYPGEVTQGLPRRSARSNNVGIYLFDTMAPHEKFEINGGIRYDKFSPTYFDSLAKDITPDTAGASAITGRIGLVFKPVQAGSFYAAYGTSFNPTGELLAFDSRGASGVKPEKNRTFEVGTKWDVLQSRLGLNLAFFRTDKTNARMTNPDDPSGPQILAGFQRVLGVELGATGQITDSWSLFAGWSWLDGEIVKGTAGLDHTPIPNTPKHSANLWTSYRMPWEIELGLGMRYVHERYWTATSTVPSYTAWDASASYSVSRRIDLQLNLMNLTDATYFETGRFWVPAAGRTARLSTILKY